MWDLLTILTLVVVAAFHNHIGRITWRLMESLLRVFSSSDILTVGSCGRAVERRTVNRKDGGSIPATAVSKLRQFH